MPTTEELRQAEKEYQDLMKWDREETEKVLNSLRESGESIGLDTHSEYFRPIREESLRRFKEIRRKYHLDE